MRKSAVKILEDEEQVIKITDKNISEFLGDRCVWIIDCGQSISDDVTHLSLKIDSKFHIEEGEMNLLIYGYGSDGMVSTSKDLIKIIGDNTIFIPKSVKKP